MLCQQRKPSRRPPCTSGPLAQAIAEPRQQVRLAQTRHVERHATRRVTHDRGHQDHHHPGRDLAAAKALYGTVLGVEPYADEAFVGFRVGDQEIGLDPNGHNHGMTGPVGYCHVDDVAASRQAVDAGWRTRQDVKDVGGGGLAAIVEDPDGNVVGVLE